MPQDNANAEHRPVRAEMLRKAVATVQTSAPLTLKERHCANLLLHNALKNNGLEDLRSKRQHTIRIADLNIELNGEHRGGHKRLFRILEGLQNKRVTWQYTTESSKRTLGASSWLAGWELDDEELRYSYSAELVDTIFAPRVWARLNTSIQNLISHSHTQALYENVARYRDIGLTAKWSLDVFRGLMGISDHKSYRDFKILNREVIKRSVTEINNKTELYITPLFKRKGRRVVGIQFQVDENDQYEGPAVPLVLPLSKTIDTEMLNERADVYEKLLQFGLDHSRCVQILESYPDAYILGNLNIVTERLRTRTTPIHNVAAYTVRALTDDFRPVTEKSEVQQGLDLEPETDRKKKQAEALRKHAADQLSQFELETLPRWRVDTWKQGLSPESLEDMWNAFRHDLSSNNAIVGRMLRDSPTSPWMQSLWRDWVKRKQLPPITDDIRFEAAKALAFDLAGLREQAQKDNA